MSNKSRRNSAPKSQPKGSARPVRTSARQSPPTQSQGSSARRTLERYSAPALVTLHSLPRWLVPAGLALLLFVGLVLSGSWAWLGALFLAVIGLFVLWLSALSWPILTASSRLVRVVVVVVLFGMAVLKAMGRW